MMLHRAITTIGLAVIFLSGYVLFTMKREVETLNFELAEIQKQVRSEKGTINLLKTEYVYLTSPSRISKLAAQYLNLSSTNPEQMMSDPTNPLLSNAPSDKVIKNIASNRSNVKWRYKHMGNKYIQKASFKKQQ